jgi:hypothetical protein
MTKREICESKPSIAYYSGFNGLEVKSIIHGINIEMYAVSNSWGGGKKTYHKLRIYSNKNGEYVRLHGYTCYLNDFIRM